MPPRAPRVLAFQAVLVADSPLVPKPSGPVTRTIAIREDQTLEQLHEAFRLAFGWADPHLYTFWVGSEFWSREAARYSAPFELAEDDLSARVPIAETGIRRGSTLAYVFDYGDEWRLLVKVVDAWEPDAESYPMLVEAEGVAPPQYLELDEGDA